MNDDTMNGYELSRNWFDWCFENPELITPTHTAMYFFIIEHWNRMGQKEKFGLPMEMTKDALGIKNYKTFSKVFHNLIDWGFIKIIQKSKNQYSANVIAISKNTKANTKALTKASLKHLEKQVRGIVGIIKPNNLITLEPITTPIENDIKNWRNDFDIYLSELRIIYKELISDSSFILEQEKFNPNIDIKLSIEKACTNYWATDAGWKKKKKSRIKSIDWKSTLTNAISLNKVYKLNGQTFKNNTASKLAGTYKAAEEFAREIEEKN